MSKSTPDDGLGVALTGLEASFRLGANYLFGRSCAMMVLLTISWSLLAAIFLFANAIVMVWG